MKQSKIRNVIQGAHSYPSSYIKSIFQKGKIPNTEGIEFL